MTGEGTTWDYHLAERLHKTVAEIHAMPNAEYDTWKEYFVVKGVLRDLQVRTQEHR